MSERVVQTSGALILAAVAAVLVVAAVVLYSLVARKMYDKDRQVFRRHREPAKPKETSGNPK